MDILSNIALAMIPGLKPMSLRRLVEYYPGEDIFALPPAELCAAFAGHRAVAEHIIGRTTFARAEEELAFCERGGIRPLFFTDDDFPRRLNDSNTPDAPVLLYKLGQADLNAARTISVVGTRHATASGRDNTDAIVSQLVPLGATIVSGLAYGIDTAAHSAALNYGLPTVAVLGHGLDRIYPPVNRHLAEEILSHSGALLTEYPSGTAISPRLFPARNRIVAALGDATVVVEAAEKGGALIPAAIAASYCRDVFAVPGRLADTYSCGTNNLIATNRAALVRSADDIAYQLGWPLPGRQAAQEQLFPTYTRDEQAVVDLLQENQSLDLDQLSSLSAMPLSKVASVLFTLEMNKVVRALPGRCYELVH